MGHGRGLDLRTGPETGGPDPGGDPGVVAKLGEAVKRELGGPALNNGPDQKKNPPGASGPGGTNRAANTNTNENKPTTAAPSNGASSRERSRGVGEGSRGQASASADVQGLSSGRGSSVGAGKEPETAEAPALNPLDLIDRGVDELGSDARDGGEQTSADEPGAADGDASTDAPADGIERELEANQDKGKRGGLRGFAEKTLAVNKELTARIKALESGNDGKVKEITAAFEAERKRAEELEAKVAFYDYSESREFREQYEEPFRARFKDATSRLGSLVKEDGSKVSTDDIKDLMTSGDLAALELIDKWFGDTPKAKLAAGLVQDVYSLDRTRQLALESSRATALQRRKESESQRTARMTALQERYREEIETRRERNAELYGPRDGDEKWNKALHEGEVVADAAFVRPANVTDEQAVAIMAEVRHRAAAFPALASAWRSQASELKALRAELAKYKGSAPGKGEAGESARGQKPGGNAELGTREFARNALESFMAEQ